MVGLPQICNELSRALATLFQLERSPAEIEAAIETPKDPSLGDAAFPCFLLAKALKKAPPAIAAAIAAELSTSLAGSKDIDKVQATGPYVNFFVNKTSVAASLLPEILNDHLLARRPEKKERVMVEYGGQNTHKAFHVGHLRNTVLGDTISRIFEWTGHPVIRVNYPGDEGAHVAKCLWYFRANGPYEIPNENRLEFLGDLYVKATNKLDLSTYTRAPVPGAVTALVTATTPHPKEKNWTVATVETKSGTATVVSAARGLRAGTLVAYAPPGTVVNGKPVGITDKGGVPSAGMVLSGKELGISDDDDVPEIEVRPGAGGDARGVGAEIVEVFRREGALQEDLKILPTLRGWESEVSEVLRGLESGDPELKSLWMETRAWSLDELNEIYAWQNCRFDHYFYESEFGESSKETALEFYRKGIFVQSEGAIGADLREYGLGFCLLIKRDGTALYATRDLDLAKRKFEEFKIDRSIYVVDLAQTLHFQQVFKCLELMGYEQVKNCYHLAYGQVVLPTGRMSSRTGTVILFSQLRDRLIAKIESEFLDKYKDEWPESERREAAHLIALGTIRYGMLTQDSASTIVFDLDAWTSKSGNTGPYMMYAYARTRSIMRELGNRHFDWSTANWSLLSHETEIDLIRHLQDYTSSIESAKSRYSPHLISNYVYELAKRFSRMYQQCSVVNAGNEELLVARAGLILAAGKVIQHGLGLLGIRCLERM